jgi:arylsulfatase A-like enzyme
MHVGTRNLNLSLNWALPDGNSKNSSVVKEARTACMARPASFNYTVDITHQHAMQWVSNHVAAQDERAAQGLARVPFFLYESFTVPHAGGWGYAPEQPESGAPVPTDGEYANRTGWPEVERDHASVITYLDAYVGEMVGLLKALDVEQDTVVFFASDNGQLRRGLCATRHCSHGDSWWQKRAPAI